MLVPFASLNPHDIISLISQTLCYCITSTISPSLGSLHHHSFSDVYQAHFLLLVSEKSESDSVRIYVVIGLKHGKARIK